MTTPFRPSRDDGRSDRQVIYDLTHNAEPGSTYTYRELAEALQNGLSQPVSRGRIYRAVAQANKTLQHEHNRYLGVVRDVGYRMLRSDEHTDVALRRKDRARTQLARGKEILVHTKLGELDAAQRDLHERQLMLLSALCGAVDDLGKRQERSEQLIEDLLKKNRTIQERLDRLDGGEHE